MGYSFWIPMISGGSECPGWHLFNYDMFSFLAVWWVLGMILRGEVITPTRYPMREWWWHSIAQPLDVLKGIKSFRIVMVPTILLFISWSPPEFLCFFVFLFSFFVSLLSQICFLSLRFCLFLSSGGTCVFWFLGLVN